MVKDQATSALEVNREFTTAAFNSTAADIDVVGAFDIDATGAISVNSSAGAISVGNDDVDQAINIGTSGERLITIGNASATNTGDIGVKIHGYRKAIQTISGTDTLAVHDSGDIIFVTQGGTAFDIVLPGASNGAHFDFILGTEGSTDVRISATTGLMYGVIYNATAAVDALSGHTFAIFDGTNANKGDRLRVLSDGTSWYVNGWSNDANGITIA